MTKRGREAAFRALVEHPYGLAAVEIVNERAWAKLDPDNYHNWLATLHHIKHDIAEARARARGRA